MDELKPKKDCDEFISLTDIHKKSGMPISRKPHNWLRQIGTHKMLKMLVHKNRCGVNELIKICRMETLATAEVASEYSSYLNKPQYSNVSRLVGRTIEIDIYNRYGKLSGTAIIDYDDNVKICSHVWRNITGYAGTGHPCTMMHRMVLNVSAELEVDHINRNRMDNRKENLRPVDRLGNAKNLSRRHDNSSGFIGVYLDNRRNKWYSQIHTNGKTLHLGTFLTKNEAFLARVEAEKKYFGEYAPQIEPASMPWPTTGGE